MSENKWHTGDPPGVGQFGRRLRGKESVGFYTGLEWLYSEHDASQTVMAPDHWCEVEYPEPPEPEKPLIQQVCEWLDVERPPAMTWDALSRATQPYWCDVEKRDALLWRIQNALGGRPKPLGVNAWTADGKWKVTLSRKIGPCHTIFGGGWENSLGDALLEACLQAMEQYHD